MDQLTKEDPRITVEDALPDAGAFGFRIRWVAEHHVVNFEVFEVCARESSGTLLFWRKGADSFDPVESIDDANVYLVGSIKWDACSHFTFGAQGDEGYLYICGLDSFKAHVALMRYLYRRAFELMGREPVDGPWED